MPNSTRYRAVRRLRLVAWLVFAVILVVTGLRGWTEGPRSTRPPSSLDAEQAAPSVSTSADAPQQFPVTIRRPAGPPVIELQQVDPSGRVGHVICSTCHSVRQPNLERRQPADLTEFHQNMRYDHGQLACYACHHPFQSDVLRLADGREVPYPDVMTLCAQCHAPRFRDFVRGAHGGMNGYWDLTRGGRVRNNCVDCHDPHVPRFPKMRPTFKPRERFLSPEPHPGDTSHEHPDIREVGRE